MGEAAGERCKRCGDEIEQDKLGWFCRGCDLRTDGRGRRLRKQPTKGEKALRRFNDRQADKAASAIETVFGSGVTVEQQRLFRGSTTRIPYLDPGRIPNYEEPPPSLHRRAMAAMGKLWCKPCDALMVRRAGKTMCWRCGIIYEPGR